METQVATIDQPFHSAYEECMEITSHLSTEMSCDKTHSEIEGSLETDGRELLRLLLQAAGTAAIAASAGRHKGVLRGCVAKVLALECLVKFLFSQVTRGETSGLLQGLS